MGVRVAPVAAPRVAAYAARRVPRRLRVALAVVLTAGTAFAGGLGAHADPAPDPSVPSQQQVDEAKAKVALASHKVEDITAALDAAEARLADLARQAGDAGEKANAAKLELDKRTAAAQAAQKAADAAAAEASSAQGKVDNLAAQLWMAGGSLDGLEVLLDAQGTTTVADRAAGLDLLTSYRGSVLGDANRASAKAATTSRAAATAKLQQQAAAAKAADAARAAQAAVASAQTQRNEVQTRRQALLTELAALQRTSVQVEQQRRAGLAAAAAKAAAAEAARRAAQRMTSTPGTDRPVHAPRGGAATAIAYAMAQLGKPYFWGGEGPIGYDCSGLTKMAWAAAGVSLDHYTGSQWDQTSHVPLSAAQPGDLIFYGEVGGDIHHVGLYLGDGQMIAAPTFGEPIQIQSIYWGDLIGYAGRV